VVAQFFLAAKGAFDSAPNDVSFALHRPLGYAIVLSAVVLTLIAAVVRMPARIIGLTGLVAGLALLQPVIRSVAGAIGGTGGDTSLAGELVFGLHAVNGLVIMALLGAVERQARGSTTGREEARTTPAEVS
jgi:hypothetical protein